MLLHGSRAIPACQVMDRCDHILFMQHHRNRECQEQIPVCFHLSHIDRQCPLIKYQLIAAPQYMKEDSVCISCFPVTVK